MTDTLKLFSNYIRKGLRGFPCGGIRVTVDSDRIREGRRAIVDFDDIQVSYILEPMNVYSNRVDVQVLADNIISKFRELCRPFKVYCENLYIGERWLELGDGR